MKLFKPPGFLGDKSNFPLKIQVKGETQPRIISRPELIPVEKSFRVLETKLNVSNTENCQEDARKHETGSS